MVIAKMLVRPVYARISRQWVVGDGGMRGVRRVKNGTVQWSNRRYVSVRLGALNGEWVFVEDFACSDITISQCLWTAHYPTRCGYPYSGTFICEAKEA